MDVKDVQVLTKEMANGGKEALTEALFSNKI